MIGGNGCYAIYHIYFYYNWSKISSQVSLLMGTKEAEYHCNDFNFEEYATLKLSTHDFLPIVAGRSLVEGDVALFSGDWQQFYEVHNMGKFFKPRRYLRKEFDYWLSKINAAGGIVAEAGCGHGCSIVPLFSSAENIRFVMTDYAASAVDIVKASHFYDTNRILGCGVWDILYSFPSSIAPPSAMPFDAMLCIFVLSAIRPEYHVDCIRNMAASLRYEPSSASSTATDELRNGVILFRDYAICDMTMFRHTLRLGENLYQRPDGTLAYYFTLEYLRSIVEDAGLQVLELEYATVSGQNRKTGVDMKRVFIHGVFCCM